MSSVELRVPPVIQLLIAALAMWAVARALPGFNVPIPGARWLFLAYAVAGFLLALAGVYEFYRAQTTVDPRAPQKSSSLVTGGVYRFTRNPMYLGMLLVLLALFFYLGSAPSFLIPVLFGLYMTRFQIVPEERHMAETFGERYATYRAAVPRWL